MRCGPPVRRYNSRSKQKRIEQTVEEIVLLGLVLLLLLGAYWSMVIFPRQRDFQKRQQFARELSAGDEVITYGGIIGKVVDIDAEMGVAHIEIADGVTVRMINAALMQPYDREAIAEAARTALEKSSARN
nr:MAG: preprotein translocase subunit YajC [Chloroflexota bacterium]